MSIRKFLSGITFWCVVLLQIIYGVPRAKHLCRAVFTEGQFTKVNSWFENQKDVVLPALLQPLLRFFFSRYFAFFGHPSTLFSRFVDSLLTFSFGLDETCGCPSLTCTITINSAPRRAIPAHVAHIYRLYVCVLFVFVYVYIHNLVQTFIQEFRESVFLYVYFPAF